MASRLRRCFVFVLACCMHALYRTMRHATCDPIHSACRSICKTTNTPWKSPQPCSLHHNQAGEHLLKTLLLHGSCDRHFVSSHASLHHGCHAGASAILGAHVVRFASCLMKVCVQSLSAGCQHSPLMLQHKVRVCRQLARAQHCAKLCVSRHVVLHVQ